MTNQELQTLRNMGNEAEAAADEIERLRTENEAVWLDGYKAACALLAKGEDEDPYGIGSMCSWCAEEIAKDLLLRVDEARRGLK